VARHGGLIVGSELDRARRVAGLVQVECSPAVEIGVLDSAAAAAYAWPSGQIFLTRQLVTDLDDDQLAAAIAHEVGHLVEGGHLESRASSGALVGIGDAERRADRFAASVLEDRGISREAMVAMLERVRSRAGSQTGLGKALSRRIAELRSVIPTH
jgi:Zn-dependent protease with chaperone function